MREWNKPQLFSLGVEYTFGNTKHPCHKTGNGEHNDSGNHVAGVQQKGHIGRNGDCTEHTTVYYDDNRNPFTCCCYPKMTSANPGEVPQS